MVDYWETFGIAGWHTGIVCCTQKKPGNLIRGSPVSGLPVAGVINSKIVGSGCYPLFQVRHSLFQALHPD